jgi:outer membrane receptor for ferrienterochelin and colicin
MEVTSVSKKEQKMLQVAAAIFVISQEDIRHSGATNIPDLLRIVPGLDVVWDTNLYFVDHLPAQLIPSYARLDTMLRWRFAEHLELTAVGQNLIRDHHVESNDTQTSVISSQVKRSAYAKFTWRF